MLLRLFVLLVDAKGCLVDHSMQLCFVQLVAVFVFAEGCLVLVVSAIDKRNKSKPDPTIDPSMDKVTAFQDFTHTHASHGAHSCLTGTLLTGTLTQAPPVVA